VARINGNGVFEMAACGGGVMWRVWRNAYSMATAIIRGVVAAAWRNGVCQRG